MRAVKEVRNDLNVLKAQCGSRVRDHIMEGVRKITPECNLEEIQKTDLLGNAEIMLFLKKHIPKTFEEVVLLCRFSVDQEAVRRACKRHHDEPHQVVSREVRIESTSDSQLTASRDGDRQCGRSACRRNRSSP